MIQELLIFVLLLSFGSLNSNNYMESAEKQYVTISSQGLVDQG